jgi:hypothetical protein
MGSSVFTNIYTKYVILCLFTTCMYVFLVMCGKEYPHQQYAVAFLLPVYSMIANLIIHFIVFGFSIKYFKNNIFCNILDAPLVGFYIAMSAVFILVSNPYTPALVQIVLNQSNIGVVCVYSRLFNGRRYTWTQIFACVMALSSGLVTLFTTQGTSISKESPIPSFLWYIFFFCGTAPTSLANARIEYIIHKKVEGVNNDLVRTYDNFSVPLFLSVVNAYAVLCTLSFFWFPNIFAPTTFWHNYTFGLKNIFSFSDHGSLWAWCYVASTTVSYLFTSYVIREKDATMNAIVCMSAAGIAGIFMGIKLLFGVYYEPVHWSVWVSFVIVFLAVLMYDGIFAKIYRRLTNTERNVIEYTEVNIDSEYESLVDYIV